MNPTMREMYSKFISSILTNINIPYNKQILKYFYYKNDINNNIFNCPIKNYNDYEMITIPNYNIQRELYNRNKNIAYNFHPKNTFHIDFNMYIDNKYPNFLEIIMFNSIVYERKNIITTISLNINEQSDYYLKWSKNIDAFLMKQNKDKSFDYISVYLNANESELADAWLNKTLYGSYDDVFHLLYNIITLLNNSTILNVFIIKTQSKKTGKNIYKNILCSSIDFIDLILKKYNPCATIMTIPYCFIYNNIPIKDNMIMIKYYDRELIEIISSKSEGIALIDITDNIAIVRYIHCNMNNIIHFFNQITTLKYKNLNVIKIDKRFINDKIIEDDKQNQFGLYIDEQYYYIYLPKWNPIYNIYNNIVKSITS